MSTCPFNIKVCISEQFFEFPYEYVAPQNDVGGAPVYNLVIYVPTDEDIQYVDKSRLMPLFKSILVYRQETIDRTETRLATKNAKATVVYWNPVVPINEIGVGETRIFSVLLTNDLFNCNTMIFDHQRPLCPIEFNSNIDYKNLTPIEGEVPLFNLNKLLNDNVNDFLICFKLETPTMIKILNIKKLISIMSYRNVPARYAIYLPDAEIDDIYNKLMWERVRRLMKGDVSQSCVKVNRQSLMYLKIALEILGIGNTSQAIVTFVRVFQPLIIPYQIVPDIIIKLNTLERQKRVRLYCKNDSTAITSYGLVPNNMPDDNVVAFDYSDINNNRYLFEKQSEIIKNSTVVNATVTAARYNYYF